MSSGAGPSGPGRRAHTQPSGARLSAELHTTTPTAGSARYASHSASMSAQVRASVRNAPFQWACTKNSSMCARGSGCTSAGSLAGPTRPPAAWYSAQPLQAQGSRAAQVQGTGEVAHWGQVVGRSSAAWLGQASTGASAARG